MKRLNFLCSFLLFAFALSFSGVSVYAQTKSQIKEAKKVAKSEAKKLAKEGWELIGIGSLESAIYEAYLKTKTGYSEYSSAVSRHSNQSQAIKQARIQAYESYAEEISTDLEAIVGNDAMGIPEATVEQMSNSLTAYSKASVYGQLKEAYTICRKSGNLFEVRSYFLLSDDDRFDAQLRALRQSIAVANLNKEVAAAMENDLKKKAKEKNDNAESNDAAED